MREQIIIQPWQPALAAVFVLAAGLLSAAFRLGLVKSLAVSAVRTAIQLAIAGLALEIVFGLERVWFVLLLAVFMLLLAGREARRRQKVRLSGLALDTMFSMTLSSFVVATTVTGLVIGAQPWWSPPYFIPIFGMVVGNSLTGISLALNHFLQGCVRERRHIEENLALGATPNEATLPLVRESVRTGMIPIINAMAIVGLVSLPGVMTGQLLAGADPKNAVQYQIIVMYMICAAVAFGSSSVVLLIRKRVFTSDMALRNDLPYTM